jgi:uncharacterized protein (TIGR02246 family)
MVARYLNMKNAVSVLVILLLSLPVFGVEASTDLAIRQVITDQQAAWNRHDLEGFMSGYWNSPDLTFFSGGNIAHGWQQALGRYRKSYQGEGKEMGQLEFSDLQIQSLGDDAAFVRGRWHLTMADGKTPHGLFTLVFRKLPAGWKIIHDHTSAE